MRRWLVLLYSVLFFETAINLAGAQDNKGTAKFSQNLIALYQRYAQQLTQSGFLSFASRDPSVTLVHDRVVIDAVAATDAEALKADLVALGMRRAVSFGRVVSGELPVSSIPAAQALASLRFANSAGFITNAGSVSGQGDPSMRADVARTTFGVDGTGFKVGVLSDGYNSLGGAAADIASGDLPAAGVQVIQDSGTTDEGRAMLQIVHDVAPGASLAFATAFGGTANFARNIIALKNAGAKVIVDDVIYFAEPMFQDGIVAQAVDSVVAGGAAYFSSAGNSARNAYQATFVNSGVNLGTNGAGQIPSVTDFFAHDFNPGPGVDNFQTVTLPSGTTFISFQWANRYFSVSGAPGAQTDLDIAVFDMSGNFLFGNFAGNIGNDPVEVVAATNNAGSPLQVQIAVGKFAGPDPGPMKYVALRSSFGINEYATNSGTIYGHANAAGAEAVGAAAYFNTPGYGVSPPILETFSSPGTTPILFDLAGNPTNDPRAQKPEIVAPDGVNTTFFGSDIPQDVDSFPNFFGTSAAAPHAAGVAALLLQAKPALTPAKTYRSLQNTAIDMEAMGFDDNSGFGLIQADGALAAAIRTTPADFEGDGESDIVVYRGGAWIFHDFASSLNMNGTWTGGGAGCIPAAMDYDGDGMTDFTQLCNGAWHFYNDDGSYNKGIWTGGVAGDVPVPADYDGNGTEEVVVFRGGAWLFYDFATGAFNPSRSVWTGAPAHWTGGTTLPAPIDYDGDGKTEFALFAGGPWHFYNADGSSNKGIWTGGIVGDRAISRRSLP